MTLISHGIFVWASGLFFIFLFVQVEKEPIKKRALFESIVFLILLVFSIIRFGFFLSGKILPYFVSAFWGNLSLYILCILAWLVLRSIEIGKFRNSLKNVYAPILKIHVAIFYFQFIVYLFFAHYIDFLEPFTGQQSRYNANFAVIQGIHVVRCTGLFVEPSTYSGVVLFLVSLLLICNGFKKNRRLLVFAIISIFLSFSTAAVIIASLFVVYILISERYSLKAYIYIIISTLLLAFFAGGKIIDFYNAQDSRYNQASGLRYRFIEVVLNRNNDEALFAKGAFALENKLALSTTGDNGNKSIASLNDSGLLFFLWAKFGFLGIFYFVILCLWQLKSSRKNLVFFLFVSSTKVTIFCPLFVLYFSFTAFKDINLLDVYSRLRQTQESSKEKNKLEVL
ncbi:hypothetical protein [Arachidicoccus rhizosphaerae]|uniref:hypothetical protein n=1 Tax=Arachidicoccus rhizosphaerae TaxID=551991 RepID=UPI001B8D8FC9|nr:hypothetical protein [Arachidicoccus rhizosphaerae]